MSCNGTLITVNHVTDEEQKVILQIQAVLGDDIPGLAGLAGALADQFRIYFTDIPDVVLSRVVLQVASHLAALADHFREVPDWDALSAWALTSYLTSAFGAAAGDLAALDLDMTGG